MDVEKIVEFVALQGFLLVLLPVKIELLLPARTDSQTEKKISLT